MATYLKKLPRNAEGQLLREFTANGVKYIIRSADEPISIRRFNEYQKMSLILGFDATFQAMYQNNRRSIELANGVVSGKNTFTDLVMHLAAVEEGLLNASKSRYEKAYYLCSLFIVRKDEDLTIWSKEIADAKIEDWNTEYSAEDFLALGLGAIPGYTNVVKKLAKKKPQIAEI